MGTNRQKRFPRSRVGLPAREARVLDEYGRILAFSTGSSEGSIRRAGLLERLTFALRPKTLPRTP